ncbi:ImmA/IrrE family metallo-endopeptidase [Marinoscillum sp. 108]|uniref:ImmA/IrrE family metallo-endopeptidase n=1 Tax=Marinoscillum sp. 108 TaxID=2653151 RepID=UPI0012F2C9ED|nr:ImmA/IrrE family metallo-endopeptidase [Marinoscillum sp. 108]VXD18945.1 Helix-turn-helix [Marinoscillum sp. 108]
MRTHTSFQPDWTSAPGQTMKDMLFNKGMSIPEFASDLNKSVDFANGLLAGYEEINPDVAYQLQLILGASSKFWLNRESIYRSQIEKLSVSPEMWLSNLPIKDMIRLGWINRTSDIYQECLNFFNVRNVQVWSQTYISSIEASRFRRSNTHDSKLGSLISWLRYGEIKASSTKTGQWNSEVFTNRLDEIKQLSRVKSPKDFLPRLNEICAECGIALVVSPTPAGCPASGAVKFVKDDKAMMLLSFRYLSDDQFWFTFFHEAGHLIMNHGSKTFIEEINNSTEDEDEKEANLFAGEALIPSPLRNEMRYLRRDKHSIVRFAAKVGVSPGIVIGQMQFEGLISPAYLNGFKRRYNWNEISEFTQ